MKGLQSLVWNIKMSLPGIQEYGLGAGHLSFLLLHGSLFSLYGYGSEIRCELFINTCDSLIAVTAQASRLTAGHGVFRKFGDLSLAAGSAVSCNRQSGLGI